MSNAMNIMLLGWWGAFPQPGGACCGVLVQTEEGSLLLDCGCGVLAQYLRFASVRDLDGALLSHLHYDHTSDIGSLFYAVNHGLRTKLRSNKLQVYAPETPKDLRPMVEYPFAKTTTLYDGMQFELAGLSITAMRVHHTVECYAFRLERGGKSFVYLTDTSYFPESSAFIQGADLLLCEATISLGTRHTIGDGHMTDLEAGITAREGNAKALCLYHLPSDGDLELMRRRAAEEFGKEVMTPDIQRVFSL
ncbi:MBL fold metallo-hydrolase [Christensenellaceae bacterium OttesenSCG-928-L17]|nr:MBL fold metallo-hydrolase [Christensenellaceae bacterium OttesenSCG-928-L17]